MYLATSKNKRNVQIPKGDTIMKLKLSTEESRIVSLSLILKIDKEIGNLANLKSGEYAEKDTKADCWIVGQKEN